MEVVVTTGAIRRAKLQSNHHHQKTNIQLFTGQMPFLRALNGDSSITFQGLEHPSSCGALSSLSVTIQGSWLLGEICQASCQPLMPVRQEGTQLH